MSSLMRFRNVICVVFAFSCTAISFSVAQAACSSWDVDGEFTVNQDNGYSPVFKLQQRGSALGGSASYEHGPSGFVTNGIVKIGSIRGSTFQVVVEWDNNTRGVYKGTFDGGGKLTGTTFDELHPDNTAKWSVNKRRFACLQ